MPTFHRYQREDMLDNLTSATKAHTGVRPAVMWVCDCGCDIAQWYQRTDAGLAFTQQAWPSGVAPKVIVMETREEVDLFVRSTVERMRRGTPGAAADARIRSFEKAVWSAWAES